MLFRSRRVVSYTMVAEPANASILRSATASTKIVIYRQNGQILAKIDEDKTAKALTKTVKAPKVAKAPVAPAPTTFGVARVSVKKDEEAIKAKNLETMKKVAAKFKAKKSPKKAKKVREFDDVTEQFGTSGEVGTSFNVDRDWDSIEGLDLSKLL